jgi:hypothetical protein
MFLVTKSRTGGIAVTKMRIFGTLQESIGYLLSIEEDYMKKYEFRTKSHCFSMAKDWRIYESKPDGTLKSVPKKRIFSCIEEEMKIPTGVSNGNA